jgi:hypothetical protein
MQTQSPHNGQSTRFWAAVKANITEEGRPSESAFSDWWSEEHVPLFTARDGFISGRRLRLADESAKDGSAEHKYLAIYEVDSIAAFNSALDAGPPWGPWHDEIDRYVCDWERTYYRVLSLHEVSGGSGQHFAIVKLDFAEEAASREAEFNDWYTNKHVPELCAHPGFHRAWRLSVAEDANDLGPRRQHYWAVYEVDSPSDFVRARANRVESGIQPWDGLWGPELLNIQMDHYEVIYAIGHKDALNKTTESVQP